MTGDVRRDAGLVRSNEKRLSDAPPNSAPSRGKLFTTSSLRLVGATSYVNQQLSVWRNGKNFWEGAYGPRQVNLVGLNRRGGRCIYRLVRLSAKLSTPTRIPEALIAFPGVS